MYITFTLEHQGNRLNLQADDNQVIRHLLAVVQSNIQTTFDAACIDYLKTYRHPEVISTDTTFAHAGIYSGDILSLIDGEAKKA